MTKRIIDKDGYAVMWMPESHMARSNGYVLEHRLVMEQMIGRPLLPEECVHHINSDRQDNRPENLELTDKPAHTGDHHRGQKRPEEWKQRISRSMIGKQRGERSARYKGGYFEQRHIRKDGSVKVYKYRWVWKGDNKVRVRINEEVKE